MISGFNKPFRESAEVVENKLCLGTAQFGMDYGVNNKTGKPSRKTVYSMLDKALESGITCFDTAPVYGNAEELLGEYIRSRNLGYALRIISKLKLDLPLNNSRGFIYMEKLIKEKITSSLRRLNVEILDGCLLHDASALYNESIMAGLQNCKNKGLIRNTGVSVYEAEDALAAARSGLVDYIQVPYNVLDRRLDKTDFFEVTRKKGITVFARSIFLQGLLLMDAADIPEQLSQAGKYIQQFDITVKKYHMSRVEGAFSFVYHNPGINYILFGVDNMLHLEQFVKLAQKQFIPEEYLAELHCQFEDVEKKIISPNLWGLDK
jgi:aryl-alcohol dehydrogenase-like predicted oxidoreductase